MGYGLVWQNNTWAWNKQVDIVRAKQRKDEEDYLKELQNKL